MNEFVTWQTLGTYAGAVMMVTIITQFLKQTPLKNINTQLLAYIISVTILIGAEAFNGSALTVQGVVLCLLNAVIVALAANGTYDAATTGMVKHTDAAILDAQGRGSLMAFLSPDNVRYDNGVKICEDNPGFCGLEP